MYRLIFNLLLRRFDAEAAHDLGLRALSVVMSVPGLRRVTRRRLCPTDPRLEVNVLGQRFSTPLGVAAGFDKEAEHYEDLAALGFGFVEVGTATAVRQDGNARPRLFRLLEDAALLNRMGFPNDGAEAISSRLRKRSSCTIVGANIGKSRITPAEQAAEDYSRSARTLAGVSDYLAINVSSPNTPGLRSFEAVEPLRELILSVRSQLADIGSATPLLVKISPDLPDAQLDEIARLALELALDGIIAVNTTLSRSGLSASSSAMVVDEAGGVSGPPTKERGLEVLKRLRSVVSDDVVLISVGGVESASDVWERLCAGASLVQAYTAFVYGGPLWPSRTNNDLLSILARSSFSTLEDAIGSAVTRDLQAVA